MPQKASAAIAIELVPSSQVTKLLPDTIINLYHRLCKSTISLTSAEEITGFNTLMSALNTFCDPEKVLQIDSDIAACWDIFTHTVLNKSTYEFSNPFKLTTLDKTYKERSTVRGKTHWDYPFTSAILAYAAEAPCMRDDSQQTLARLAFGYITSVALTISTIKLDNRRYEGIKHLNQVMSALITNDACRQLFNKENTAALVKMNVRITQFFAPRHAEQETSIIPDAIENFVSISRELASQLFDTLLIATEGANKKGLSRDYYRITRDEITDELPPKVFNPNNPFRTLIKTSAASLNTLHNEPDGSNAISRLEKPDEKAVKKFIAFNLTRAISYHGSWFEKQEHGLQYFFMRAVDPKTQKSHWLTEQDPLTNPSQHLTQLAHWLKYTLVLSSAMKSLCLLLSMDGQKWIAQGRDASVIQALIKQASSDLAKFKDDMRALGEFLRNRIGIKHENEHGIILRVQTLMETIDTLNKKALTPLLNIKDTYLVTAEYIEDIRHEFFARIVTLMNGSNLGFSLPEEPSEVSISNESYRAISAPQLAIRKRPNPGAFMHIELTTRLSSWMTESFQSKNQTEFLRFWEMLLYVQKDHGLKKGSKLPKLVEFHRSYRHNEKKLIKQLSMNENLKLFLKQTGMSIERYAKDVISKLHKSPQNHEVALHTASNNMETQLKAARKASSTHLLNQLNIPSGILTAWDTKTHTELKKILTTTHGIPEDKTSTILKEVSRLLLQRDESPDSVISEALDALLITTLNRVVHHTDNKENKDYWSNMCRGLMMLGANPLSWMDDVMEGHDLVPEEKSHSFFVAARQSTLILSSLTHRSLFLGENSAHLKEKLDTLLKAVDNFGSRLYSCVGDDTTWWWDIPKVIGFKNYGGARIERATLFWAAIRWLYVSLNEQLLEEGTDKVWSKSSAKALEYIEKSNTFYKTTVPKKSAFYNQGYQTWVSLTAALKDFIEAIDTDALLRRQKTMAIEIQSIAREATHENKRLQEENMGLKTNNTAQKDKISAYQIKEEKRTLRHLEKKLMKILPSISSDMITHGELLPQLNIITEQVTDNLHRDDEDKPDQESIFKNKVLKTRHLLFKLIQENELFNVLKPCCLNSSQSSHPPQGFFSSKRDGESETPTPRQLAGV